MTDLYNGALIDMLPAALKSPEAKALSYALQKMVRWLMDMAAGTHIPTQVASLAEPVLDYLAQELRALYYSDDLPKDVKAVIIEKTPEWFMRAGTAAAVEELISVVFGMGALVEWPDYTEPPYTKGTFDIITNAILTPDIVDRFTSMIDRVKKKSAHIRRILIERTLPAHWYIGGAVWEEPSNTVLNSYEKDYLWERPVRVGTGVTARPHTAVDNNVPGRSMEAEGAMYVAGATLGRPAFAIDNTVEPKETDVQASPKAATAARSVVSNPIDTTVWPRDAALTAVQNAAVAGVSRSRPVITNAVPGRARSIGCRSGSATAAVSMPKISIPTVTKPRRASAKGALFAGAAAVSHVSITIGR